MYVTLEPLVDPSIRNCTGPSSSVILKLPCPLVTAVPELGQLAAKLDHTYKTD